MRAGPRRSATGADGATLALDALVGRQGAPESEKGHCGPAPILLAIDPGPYESAYCVLDGTHVLTGKDPNAEVLEMVRTATESAFAVEMIAGSYGQSVGIETMLTAVWIGRFVEAWESAGRPEAHLVFRKTAVTHVTGNPKANDSHVRQALIDRWGGDSVALARAVKCLKCKGKGELPRGALKSIPGIRPCYDCGCSGQVGIDGPLRGVTKDGWAALAVAVTARDGLATRPVGPGAGGPDPHFVSPGESGTE